APAAPRTSTASSLSLQKTGEVKLDLEGEGERERERGPAAKTPVASAAAKQVRTRRMLGALLAVVAAGAGGAFFYQRHHAKQQRAEQIQEHLAEAHKAIHAAAPNHWTRAANEATEVLSLDEHNVDAMGLRAEALVGGVLDTGIGGDTKIAMGKKVLADALEAGITGPQLDAAQALGMIGAHQPDRAVTKLQAMVKREPKNGFWQLYLGWALAAKGDPAGAVTAFDAALAADPAVKLPALYARGRAKIQLL